MKNNKHKKNTKHQGQLDIQKLEEPNMREKYIQEVNEEFAKLPENTQHTGNISKIPSYKQKETYAAIKTIKARNQK